MLGFTKQKTRTDDNIRNNKILLGLGLKIFCFLNISTIVAKINRSNDKYKTGPATNKEKIKRTTINMEKNNSKPFFEINVRIIIDKRNIGEQYWKKSSFNKGSNKEIMINKNKNI